MVQSSHSHDCPSRSSPRGHNILNGYLVEETVKESEVDPMCHIVDKAIACSSVCQFISWVAERDVVAQFEHCIEAYAASNNHPDCQGKSTFLSIYFRRRVCSFQD